MNAPVVLPSEFVSNFPDLTIEDKRRKTPSRADLLEGRHFPICLNPTIPDGLMVSGANVAMFGDTAKCLGRKVVRAMLSRPATPLVIGCEQQQKIVCTPSRDDVQTAERPCADGQKWCGAHHFCGH